MDQEWITSLLAQAGGYGVLIAYMAWSIKGCKEEIKAERERNEKLTERVINMAEAQIRTATELKNAVERLHGHG